MLRGVVYRLIESLASMGHSSKWKLICAISVCNTLAVGVYLSSTPALVVLDPPLNTTSKCSSYKRIKIHSVSFHCTRVKNRFARAANADYILYNVCEKGP